jgi:hypothetical protein
MLKFKKASRLKRYKNLKTRNFSVSQNQATVSLKSAIYLCLEFKNNPFSPFSFRMFSPTFAPLPNCLYKARWQLFKKVGT